jgi:hypothetical protein
VVKLGSSGVPSSESYVTVERPTINVAGVLLVVVLMLSIINLVIMLQLYSYYSNLKTEIEALKATSSALSTRLDILNKNLAKYEKIDQLIELMIESIVRKLINATVGLQ